MRTPPRWADRFLEWYCNPDLVEDLQGDLHKRFNQRATQHGIFIAKLLFVVDVVSFLRPYILKRSTRTPNPIFMIKPSYHLRVLLKDGFFTLLNVVGLGLGISVSIIMLLMLNNDLTYDLHYPDHNRIYRLGADYHITGIDSHTAATARELAPVLKAEFPEVEAFARVAILDDKIVTYQNNGGSLKFNEEGIAQADDQYFKVFKHKFIKGSIHTCMKDPGSIVLTESTAKKYFGDDDPLGKVLTVDNEPRQVTAVIHDLPGNTHLRFDILIAGLSDWRDWANDGEILDSEAFWNPDVYTYILVPEDWHPSTFIAKWQPIYDKYFKSTGDKLEGRNTPLFEKLADIHFHSNFDDDETHGNLAYLYSFIAVGIFVVLLACINYMNLATAKSIKRGTEVAVKKVLGQSKRNLAASFLGESVFLALISFVLATGFVFLVLRFTNFSKLIGIDLLPGLLDQPGLLFGGAGIALLIGLISGLYPAFYLPSIATLDILKSGFKSNRSSRTSRNALVLIQFAVSIFVMICVLFIKDQVNFMKNKDLGFTKDHVIVIPVPDETVRKLVPAIKNDMLLISGVKSLTTSNKVPGMDIGTGVMLAQGATGMEQRSGIAALFVGDDYLTTMEMNLVNGRNLKSGDADMEGVYLANESAIRALGWSGEDPIGKRLSFYQGQNPGHLIGVIKDFNFTSLHRTVEPMLILKGNWFNGFMQIRISGDDVDETVRLIKDTWLAHDPDHPFEFFFLNEKFNEQYLSDNTESDLLTILGGLCIFISLLGLIGLSAFNANQRIKEIGIRKVLGSRISSIIFLLAKDTLVLLTLAILMVTPFAIWVRSQWITNYAYQSNINYISILLVIAVSIIAVYATIGLQSYKAALANPVKSLKTE